MADQKIAWVDGKPNYFPADATDAEISSALNAIPAANAKTAPKARTWTDTAVDAIPMLSGMAGAAIGGAGGTVLGMGIGGVPGAAGGATVGTAGGEALKQLINRARGSDAPETPGDAAMGIGVPALEAGASTAALGAAGQYLAPRAGAILTKTGRALAESPSWRQLAGQAVEKLGEKLTVTPTAPKPSWSAVDFSRFQALKNGGLSEADAISQVMSLKLKDAISAASKIGKP